MGMGGYPLGAENDSFAPYNKEDNEYKDFNIHCTQTIEGNFKVKSNRYTEINDSVDYECTDWKAIFDDELCYTPIELLNGYKNLVSKIIEYNERHYPEDKNLKKYKKEAAVLERQLLHYNDIDTIIEPA